MLKAGLGARERFRGAGFTVFELLVTMCLLVILIGIALPRLSELSQSFNRLNARSYLIQDLKQAQAHAITEGCRGIFIIAPDGESYTFGCDYLGYDASDPPSHDSVKFARFLPANVKLESTGTLIFNSRGQSVDKDYIISNRTLSLIEYNSTTFASGTLLGTGVFNFD